MPVHIELLSPSNKHISTQSYQEIMFVFLRVLLQRWEADHGLGGGLDLGGL